MALVGLKTLIVVTNFSEENSQLLLNLKEVVSSSETLVSTWRNNLEG
jgi:hypothetical protein